jgi:hypothetical protein
VVFADQSTPADRDRILAIGIVDQYPMIDSNAAVLRLTAAQRTIAVALPGVSRIGIWAPASRIDRKLAALWRDAANAESRVQIDFFDDVDEATNRTIAGILENLGAREVVSAPGGIRALVPHALLDDIARISDVRWIEAVSSGP